MLGLYLLTETVLHVWGTVKGVDVIGATGYAGLWLVGTVALGAWFDFVGGPSD